MSRAQTLFAKLALFGTAMIWGSSFFIVKDTVNTLPPNLLLAVRFSVACVLLSILFWKKLKKIDRTYLWQGAVIGLFLFLAYSTQTIGITDTTPGKNAFLTAIYCVIVPFLFWLVGRHKPDIYNFTAAVLCIVGIGFVSLTQAFTISFGDALTLLSGFLFAAHLVAVTKFGSDKNPVLITILQFFFAAIFSWIAMLISEPFPTAVSVDCIWSVAYLAVLCTAGALLLQNIGQKYTNPSAAAIILSLESVFGVLFSVLFGYETLTPKLIFGFVLIFAAVLLSETKLSFLKKKNREEN